MSTARILVLGLGETSDPALAATAARLATALGLRLVVVHAAPAIDPPQALLAPDAGGTGAMLAGRVPSPADDGVDGRREEIERTVRERSRRLGLGDAPVHVALGLAPADLLRQVADEEDAELLVVGSRGRGSMKAAFLGSTAHALVTHAPCPVVVVPVSAG